MPVQEVRLSLPPTELLLRCRAQPYVALLDGGSGRSWGSGQALLGFEPRATLRIDAAGEAIMRCGGGAEHWHGTPLALLERFRAQWVPPCAEPSAGGIVVALSYELRRWIERCPARHPDHLPVLHAAAYDWLLAYCYQTQRYWVASSRLSGRGLRHVALRLEALAATDIPRWQPTSRPVTAEMPRRQYDAAVAAALAYIAAGDVYQINLAQRFVVENPQPPVRLFAALQRHPMPFAAYADLGDAVLVSNSPECLLRLRDGRAATFPIKGTRPRSNDAVVDRQLARELESSAKDHAEHVMIVDLARNDLGRVCRIGSVRVAELARLHSFPSLHHLISEVVGELRPGVTLETVLGAIFPGGSITGAPKIRAMEIIDELEPIGRGFYTGALGFLGADGSAVFSLLIRTAIATGDMVTYHAGGGIVADSMAAREFEETLLKARPFFEAVAAG
jgi:para-aminobenzoate synthetase component 1